MFSTPVSTHQAGPVFSSLLASDHCLYLSFLQPHPLPILKRARLISSQPIIMHFQTVFAATAMVGSVLAVDHNVAVGTKTGELVFKPDTITAAEGDTVTFRFWPKNHSIAQAAFNSPCTPLNNGFWSGFVPTTDTNNVANWTFTYEVTNASAPVWFYCTQGKHCQSGMVGVINPP